MRIVNKKRFMFSITSLLLLILLGVGFLTSNVFSYTKPNYYAIVVSEGDTLWSIAKNAGGNINKTIYEIKEINNLNSSSLYIGQELLLPFEYN